MDLRRFSEELFVHSRSAISNWTGLRYGPAVASLRLPGHWSRGGGVWRKRLGWGWARLPALGAGGRKPSSEICGILVSRDTIRSMAGTKLCFGRVSHRPISPIKSGPRPIVTAQGTARTRCQGALAGAGAKIPRAIPCQWISLWISSNSSAV